MPTKQAVVYILDGSSSMITQSFGSSLWLQDDNNENKKPTRTRFECAKQGILNMMGNLMMDSKVHECSCIVLKTTKTWHHKYPLGNAKRSSDDDSKGEEDEEDEELQDAPEQEDCPHLTEYPKLGLTRPNLTLLRQIQSLEPNSLTTTEQVDGGDFLDGLVLAQDALRQRTHKKKYERTIVLWTDVRGYDAVMHVPQILQVIDQLRELECRLYVVGMDFTTISTVDYLLPAQAPSSSTITVEEGPSTKKSRTSGEDDQQSDGDDEKDEEEDGDDDEDDDDEEDDPNIQIYKNAEDRERLLQSLTEKTGGSVLAAQNMQEILQHQHGQQKRAVSTANWMELVVAPGLVLPNCKFSIWAKPETATKAFQYEAAQKVVNEDGEEQSQTNPETQQEEVMLRTNALGEEMLEPITKIHSFVDPLNIHRVYSQDEVCKAVRYGSSLIPLSVYEMESIKGLGASIPRPQEASMQVLGYLPRHKVPRMYCQGYPYRIFSIEKDSCEDLGLRALARALEKMERVALVNFFKRKDSDPILGGLFPQDNMEPHEAPLVFLQLPYAGDVKHLPVSAFTVAAEQPEPNEAQIAMCRNLIRKLDLSPPHTSLPVFAQNPFLTNWNQSLLAKALDPQAEPVTENETGDMRTPPHLLKEAASSLNAFRKAFPMASKTS